MNNSPIIRLSNILNEDHKYLSLNKENLVITTSAKEKPLSAVLPVITKVINDDRINNNTKTNVVTIKNSIDQIYKHYQTSVNTHLRLFLKTLAKITPKLLKPYLPACFSNRMAEAEKETNQAYQAFLKEIEEYQNKSSLPKKTNSSNHTKAKPSPSIYSSGSKASARTSTEKSEKENLFLEKNPGKHLSSPFKPPLQKYPKSCLHQKIRLKYLICYHQRKLCKLIRVPFTLPSSFKFH